METFVRRRLAQRLTEVLAADRLPPVEGVEVAPGLAALAAYPPARLAVVAVEDVPTAVASGEWRVLAVDLDQLTRDPAAVVLRVRAALCRRARDRHPATPRRARTT